MPNFLSKLLSIGADRELKEFEKIAARVNDLEPKFTAMSEDELRGCTAAFRERYAQGETLDDLLPEAFAAVREASRRTTGLRHFDVQIIGGIALHRGTIAEMKTGEGKTLVSTLAGYLNAIPGKGVHIVTVNDYLARRDSEWMGQIYRYLGMSVGLIQNGMRLNLKKPAYAADVTYGTNSEFGFDYLRDNMVTRASMRVQRGHHYAIVDEADSILIDEARTPLIISGAGTKSASTYKDFARAVRGLTPEVDYTMDEAKHTIATTDDGLKRVEAALGIEDIYADVSGQLVNHLQQALKAEYMFHRDQQYVVVDGEVKIVDEFTGRIMEGRRYSEGLHQAIEAKEGVHIREENQTLATITLQNYFLMYDKLSGMTGTAMTEDAEFREVYHIPVQVIPPNKPVIRVDHDDLVYRTLDCKFKAVADDVVERHAKGQPCLVGTVSIENSEKLSRILDKRGIKHSVLNAKYHEREAQIVAQAGREGAVTIATNMAGRGTDILLGGNAEELAEEAVLSLDFGVEQATVKSVLAAGDPARLTSEELARQGIEIEPEVLLAIAEERTRALAEAKERCAVEREHVIAAGGLYVIGTERHESRRIDNQLRGRSGRQGDPGETQFYLSLEDDLMRLFGGDRMEKIAAMMQKYQMPDDMPIQSKMVTRAVESAQRKVEEVNFSMRKNVLDYDNVMNTQRQVIYEERNNILDGKDLMAHIDEVTLDVAKRVVGAYCPENAPRGEWDVKGLNGWLEELTGRKGDLEVPEKAKQADVVELVDAFVDRCFSEKSERLGADIMQALAAQVMLRVIDTRWMSYLQEMDYLKTGIGLRGFGQRDPLVEYKSEAYAAFTELVATMYEDFLRMILHFEVIVKPAAPAKEEPVEDEPAELRGAQYSGPREVDGDQGARPAMAPAPAGAAPSAPQPGAGKPRTYRKSEDPDPYVGVGRNDPCPCGSGKKFKNCHGRNR
ncbi:preprotein translocase subunit SecA [Olsenella sp. An290]|uniref:preprotein translocase subunit SecA n=1 Tax=Olsenella sp. An290 TaxID=1965625 RepID=UPI000B385B72|nr:preprotein translocase subunit SecA [Olsenella sp. An290]OUO34043.1 preprotein translocase subunit SecA [Olsenella sp. An290]